MGIKQTSLELAAISLIADQSKKKKDELRAKLLAEMNEIGADRVRAELEDQTVAYVTTASPRVKRVITNDKAFLKWVKEKHPTEIVESVRESFVDIALQSFNFVDGQAIDSDGETIDWIIEQQGEPYLVTKFHAYGREMLIDALSNQNYQMEVSLKEILQIE